MPKSDAEKPKSAEIRLRMPQKLYDLALQFAQLEAETRLCSYSVADFFRESAAMRLKSAAEQPRVAALPAAQMVNGTRGLPQAAAIVRQVPAVSPQVAADSPQVLPLNGKAVKPVSTSFPDCDVPQHQSTLQLFDGGICEVCDNDYEGVMLEHGLTVVPFGSSLSKTVLPTPECDASMHEKAGHCTACRVDDLDLFGEPKEKN